MIADAQTPVAAYHVENPHAAGTLVGYVPSAQIAFNSDLYNPSSPPVVLPPFGRGKALYDSSTVNHQIPVAFMAGGHGGPRARSSSSRRRSGSDQGEAREEGGDG